MITLYTFGPALGLPDPSPFVTKAEILLKMSGQPYETKVGNIRKAPKGKLPYIEDDGIVVSDSTFIRFHLEEKYGVEFDADLDETQRAVAWAFKTMAEEHLYWAMVHERWVNDTNFNNGPKMFFQVIPAFIRPLIIGLVRGAVRKTLHGQGLGRHNIGEIATLASRDFKAMADYLGDKPFFFGDIPTAVDATLFSFISGSLCSVFTGPYRAAAEHYPTLKAYAERMHARYFPG